MSPITTKKASEKDLVHVLRTMILSRVFEEKVNEMFMQGIIHGTTHLGVGQEACHAGVSLALEKEDWILPTHRGHGHCLAKGATAYEMFCELFANTDGPCLGMGGSMHLTDTKNFNMGSSGIVAGAVPMAVGMADALRRQNKKNVVISFFGDAASNQGMTAEALNLASVWKSPVIFCCENNRYGMSTPAKLTVSVEDIAVRGKAYNMKSKIVDGNDVVAVLDAMEEARKYCVSGKGPYLLELKTYRYLGHSKSDQRKYRTKDEEADMKANNDPIIRFKDYLMDKGVITEESYKALYNEVEQEINEASEKARDKKDTITFEKALEYVYTK